MQVLFALTLLMLIGSSLFIGNAISDGYHPFSSMFGGFFYFVALFIPFIGEYSLLHRSVNAMGQNFKKIIGTERQIEQKGQIEIIGPSSVKVKAQSYSFDTPSRPHIPLTFFLIVASFFFTFDLVYFYFFWEGAPVDGPITNF